MPWGKRPRLSLEERFWPKVDKRGECWLWTGAVTNGYGVMSLKFGRGFTQIGAHRISYYLEHGSIPLGMDILHKCDTPLCVRPSHLFAGDATANALDAMSKNRLKFPVGIANGRSKLTPHQIRIIRRLVHSRESSTKEIARRFGIHSATVRQICKRETWKQVS